MAELGPLRDLSRNPIVQVLFQLVTAPAGVPPRLGDAELADVGGVTGGEYGEVDGQGTAAPFDLDLFMAPAPSGLALELPALL